MRQIDGDELRKQMLNTPIKALEGASFNAEWFTRIGDTANQMIDMVENAPTLEPNELKPVIRCKDCRNYWKHESYWIGECHAQQWDTTQGCIYPKVDEDDYCSYGERMMEE